MNRFLVFLVIFTLAPYLVWADSPIPKVHPTQEIEARTNDIKTHSKALKKKIKSIENELGKTRTSMISLASKMKANEKKILILEKQIQDKKQAQMAVEVKLQEDKGTISDLVLGLERIDRVPPEALLAKPGSPLKTAQSAMLLESVLPSIYERADQLKKDKENLETIIEDLKSKEEVLMIASKELASQENKLKSLVHKREGLLSKTQNDYKKQTAEIKIVSAQAKNLKDLMKKIERKQERADKMAKDSSKSGSGLNKAGFIQKTPMPKVGRPQLPVSGIITIPYGRKNDIGAKSEGLKIQTRLNSVVVAPMGGIVEYAGSFRNYGNMVLIKHKNNYRSLIAGLGKINALVGQSVSAGEPIGKTLLKNNLENTQNYGDVGKTTLYYELRYNGNPINPSKKFAGIR